MPVKHVGGDEYGVYIQGWALDECSEGNRSLSLSHPNEHGQ